MSLIERIFNKLGYEKKMTLANAEYILVLGGAKPGETLLTKQMVVAVPDELANKIGFQSNRFIDIVSTPISTIWKNHGDIAAIRFQGPSFWSTTIIESMTIYKYDKYALPKN